MNSGSRSVMSCFLRRQIWKIEMDDSIGKARIAGREKEKANSENIIKTTFQGVFLFENLSPGLFQRECSGCARDLPGCYPRGDNLLPRIPDNGVSEHHAV